MRGKGASGLEAQRESAIWRQGAFKDGVQENEVNTGAHARRWAAQLGAAASLGFHMFGGRGVGGAPLNATGSRDLRSPALCRGPIVK